MKLKIFAIFVFLFVIIVSFSGCLDRDDLGMPEDEIFVVENVNYEWEHDQTHIRVKLSDYRTEGKLVIQTNQFTAFADGDKIGISDMRTINDMLDTEDQVWVGEITVNYLEVDRLTFKEEYTDSTEVKKRSVTVPDP